MRWITTSLEEPRDKTVFPQGNGGYVVAYGISPEHCIVAFMLIIKLKPSNSIIRQALNMPFYKCETHILREEITFLKVTTPI